jgi:hypothetical protein
VCIHDLHLVALGNLCDWRFLITLGDCHYLDDLVDCGLHREACKKIVRCSREGFVRGIVLIPREPRRAILVESAIELLSLVGRYLRRPTCGLGL